MTLDQVSIEQHRRRLVKIIEHEIFKHYGVKMFWDLIFSDNGVSAIIRIPFNPEQHPEIAKYLRDGLEMSREKKRKVEPESVDGKEYAWAELPTRNPCAEIPLGEPKIGAISHPIPKSILQVITENARKDHAKRMNEYLDMIGEGLLAAARQGLSEVVLTLPWDAKVEAKIKALYSQLITWIEITGTLNQAKVTFRWPTYQEENVRRYGST